MCSSTHPNGTPAGYSLLPYKLVIIFNLGVSKLFWGYQPVKGSDWFSLLSTGEAMPWSTVPSSGLFCTGLWVYWRESSEGPQRWSSDWSISEKKYTSLFSWLVKHMVFTSRAASHYYPKDCMRRLELSFLQPFCTYFTYRHTQCTVSLMKYSVLCLI